MHTIRLTSAEARERACRAIRQAPQGFVVEIREPRRTQEQNAIFWSLLTALSHAKPRGIVATPDDWKAMVMHACGFEQQFLQGLDGRPFPVGFRSSKLSKAQMSELIEWIYAFAAENGVSLERDAA